MKLQTLCNSCKVEITIKSSASTRPDLEKEKGEEFQVNCQSCGSRFKIHVNEVIGKENIQILIFGIILGFIVTMFLWKFYGAIGTVSIIIPILIWKGETSSAHTFNSYRLNSYKRKL